MSSMSRHMAHRALGPHCRLHRAPVREVIGGVDAWRCLECGSIISQRDACGLPYPPTKAQLLQQRRDQLIAEAEQPQQRVPRSLNRKRLTKADVEVAAKRYHTSQDAAAALGVTSSSFRRAIIRFGIEWESSR